MTPLQKSVMALLLLQGVPSTRVKRYHIVSSAGVMFGCYEGDSPRAALDALAREAGYADHAEACQVAGEDPNDWTTSMQEFQAGSILFLIALDPSCADT